MNCIKRNKKEEEEFRNDQDRNNQKIDVSNKFKNGFFKPNRYVKCRIPDTNKIIAKTKLFSVVQHERYFR